ncbi:hypothetical protein B0H34DRAFT_344121 [Crassisporium funariophilum]|nr:hypothetical protein B0H34DRAFT_344121 [Crassisporium funariophilum]
MDSLRKLRTKVFTKNSSTVFGDNIIISSPKKPRDKELRHSRSMPLRNSSDTDKTLVNPGRPTYKGKHPLKPSDIRLALDNRGRPDATILHPAFEESMDYRYDWVTGPIPTPPSEDIIAQFPSPPDGAVPRRPEKPAPHLSIDDILPSEDLLPANPAFERMKLLKALRAEARQGRQGHSHHNNLSASDARPAYTDIVQPLNWNKSSGYHDNDAHRPDNARTIMQHPNYSTKSLGPGIAFKEGPARRVVVNKPARLAVTNPDPRPRMQSNASSHSVMNSTSPRPRMQSNASSRSVMNSTGPSAHRRHDLDGRHRQRLVSNPAGATSHQTAELGYIPRADPYHQKYHGSTSHSRPRN